MHTLHYLKHTLHYAFMYNIQVLDSLRTKLLLMTKGQVVIGVVNEYHLIPTPIFSSFKPPSVQKRRKI